MPEVRWAARRTSDSVLVDVTADVTGSPLGAPSQNPIEGGGAGGVTVDNQSDPPAAVTTLIVPGATIAGDEATLVATTKMLGPLRVNFDDDDIEGSPGTLVAEDVIPAGSIVIRVTAMPVTPWIVPMGPNTDITIAVGPTAVQSITAFATHEDAAVNAGVQHEFQYDQTLMGEPPPAILMKADGNIYLQAIDSGDAVTAPTQGALDLYVFYATPAA